MGSYFKILIFSLCIFPSFALAADKVTKGSRPKWVEPVDSKEMLKAKPKKDVEIHYILIDRQDNYLSHESYYHQIHRFVAQSSVRSGAEISVTFDPSYEKVKFHKIALHRNGDSIDLLKDQQFRYARKESTADRRIYDHSITATAILKGVQAGDALEFSYSVEGAMPTSQGRKHKYYRMSWGVSIDLVRTRVLTDESSPLLTLWEKGRFLYSKSNKNSLVEHLWTAKEVKPVIADDRVPGFYDKYDYVEVSTWENWSNVIEWGISHYSADDQLTGDLKNYIHLLKKEGELERVQKAYEYVRDKIRYVAISDGVQKYEPHSIFQILERKFGDCKDQTKLLLTMLKALDVEAYPLLVHTKQTKMVNQGLPGIAGFNHVLVVAKLGGEFYLLDPTASHARGDVKKLFEPDYEYGLLLKKGLADLYALPGRNAGTCSTSIFEEYTLKDYKGDATLAVRSEYRGCDANQVRSSLGSQTKEEIKKNYLNYYSNDYDNISLVGEIEIRDNEKDNVYVTLEKYKISHIWKVSKEDETMSWSLHPRTIYSKIKEPESKQRTMPLSISYPENIVQTFKLNLPSDLLLSKDLSDTKVHDEAFEYASSVKREGKADTISYQYKTKKNHVPVARLDNYFKNHDRMWGDIGVQITVPASYRIEYPSVIGEEFWYRDLLVLGVGLLVSALLGFGITFFGSIRKKLGF